MPLPMDAERADKRFEPVKKSKVFNRILDSLSLRHQRVLDLGCGYGEYLVCFGRGSVGVTTTPEEVEYGKLRNISIVLGNAEKIRELPVEGRFQAIWANNLFEHLLSPHAFLISLKPIADPGALLILGVPVVPRIATLMSLRKFRGALAIAHINFFTRESLRLTVERAGWQVIDVRPFVFSHAFLDRIVGFVMPHLYVVAKNDVNFTYHEKKLKEWEHDPHYRSLLEVTGQ